MCRHISQLANDIKVAMTYGGDVMIQSRFQILMLNGLHFDTSGRVDFTTLNGDIKLFLEVITLVQTISELPNDIKVQPNDLCW